MKKSLVFFGISSAFIMAEAFIGLFVLVNRDLYGFGAGTLALVLMSLTALTAAYFFVYRRFRGIWANALLVIFSVTAPLYLAETYFHFKLAPAESVTSDPRSLHDVVKELRNRGDDAYPAIVPTFFLDKPITVGGIPTVPLGGIANALVVLCRELWGYAIVRNDRFGFPNPSASWQGERANVALVGDSFTQGMCVPAESHFSSLIRRAIPHTVNVAAGGNGPLAELGSIREYLSWAKPKIVLWFFYEGNDLSSNLEVELRNGVLSRYRDRDYRRNLRARQPEIDRALRAFADDRLKAHDEKVAAGRRRQDENDDRGWRDFLARDRLRGIVGGDAWTLLTLGNVRDWINRATGISLFHSGDDVGNPLPRLRKLALFGNILGKAKAEVRTWGGHFVLVYLPSYASVGMGLRNDDHESVLAIAGSLGIPVIDMSKVFDERLKADEVFPAPLGHYSPRANALIADEVLAHLARTE
jgi:hypothetical protein